MSFDISCIEVWSGRLNINIRPAASEMHHKKTCLYNFAPLKPHFYIVKLGFTGVDIIFLISAQKHRLWVLVRTASPRRFLRVPTIYVWAEIWKISVFYQKIFSFWRWNFLYIWIGVFFSNAYRRTIAHSSDSGQTALSHSQIRIFTGSILDSHGCKMSSCEQQKHWLDCTDAQGESSLR